MTSSLPDPIRNLADALKELPGIGPRQAIRLAIFLATQKNGARDMLGTSLAALGGVKLCAQCFFFHEETGALCNICADTARDQSVIMVVEKETDLISLERTGKFRGRYLVLGPIPKLGALAGWQQERIAALKASIMAHSGQAKEVILAFNPTSIGDMNASLIQKELAGITKKLSRLGRGLPTGGEIEFADDETLGSALEGRN
jgi:recombination protein RecR